MTEKRLTKQKRGDAIKTAVEAQSRLGRQKTQIQHGHLQ
jgi:hypothetical protein